MRKILLKLTIALAIVAAVTGILVHKYGYSRKPMVFRGAVLRDDTDPLKQSPIANVQIEAFDRSETFTATSDASGAFTLTVNPGWLPRGPITFEFEHSGYKPVHFTVTSSNQLYIVRMEPTVRGSAPEAEGGGKPVKIQNVRVRYTFTNVTTINQGTVAKEFQVVNRANVPCDGRRPCSPDGKWKAAVGRISLDPQKGDEFRNVRVSCIAGPCPFTKLEPANLPGPVRKLEVTALDWSDTANFLLEADVTRTVIAESSRQLFPFVIGRAMSFSLPAAAEGPTVVADLNGEEIIFPLGPRTILDWANCSVEAAGGGGRIYRCELKAGYRFQE